MADSIERLLEKARQSPNNLPYRDLKKICDSFFGPARQEGTSHAVCKMPWQGDPRVNIQSDKGKAKAYQVRQVLQAIDKLKESSAKQQKGV